MKTFKFFIFSAILFCLGNQNVSASIPLPSFSSTQILITDYGATTSSTDNATAINNAITAASAISGGATVVFPAGTFLSGPITMKSNVNLYLASGDTLRILPYGSGNGTVSGTYPNNGTTDQYSPFIFGQNLSNIAVSGSGVIDGQGSAWWTAYESNSSMKRPCLIRFKACSTVLVTGITLMNSPGVNLTMGQSSSMGYNATISYLTITAPSTSPNTDAIDTWYWNGIYIHDCNLSEGDDNIAMDSYSQNVTIKHCTFGTGHGLSVGSYATGVNNIYADSCTFTGTTNGIRLKSNIDRGGSDSTFVYSNMTMTNVTYPFYITSWYDDEPYPASSQASSTVTSTTPVWKNITFKNITVNNSTYGGIIYGRPEAYVQNITFDNVTINATSRGMVVNYVSNMNFTNCSSLTIPSGKGNPFLTSTSSTSSSTNVPYDADISGINISTGASTSCDIIKSTLDATTCTSASGAASPWYFSGGYSISNASSKTYATASPYIKYSSGVHYTVSLPDTIAVDSVKFIGYDNYADGNSYLSEVNGTTFSSTQYVFPARPSSSTYTLSNQTVYLSNVKGSFTFTVSGYQICSQIVIYAHSAAASSGINEVTSDSLDPNGLTDVYSVTGQLIKRNIVRSDAENNLPNGIYIIDRQKVIVNK